MSQRVVLVASLTACFAVLTACGANHFVQRGADLYAEGRYVEADEVFDRSEPRVARASLRERATYAAYRGATFMALGDLVHAQHWLNVAGEIERSQPGTLGSDERTFLDGAWQALNRQKSQTPPAPSNSAIASSRPAPSPSEAAMPPPGETTTTTTTTTTTRALVPQ